MPAGKGENKISVIDHRTGCQYEIPLEESDGNCVRAVHFKQIKYPLQPVKGEKEEDEDDADFGMVVYDPAFLNTACVNSKISYIDGDRGILQYRGYPIEELAEKSNFLEVAFLLLFGELPSPSQYSEWSKEIMTHTFLHVKVIDLMQNFHYDAHPMGMFISSMAAMSAFHPEANPSLNASIC
jgi:citrate synthase